MDALVSNAYLKVEDRLLDAVVHGEDPEIVQSLSQILEERAIYHYFTRTNRGYIGITLFTERFVDGAGDSIPAVRVATLYPDAPGQQAGLQTNDMIIAVDGRRIEPWMQNEDFIRHVQARKPGDAIQLHVARNDGIHEFKMVLGERPKQVAAAVNAQARVYSFNTAARTQDQWFEDWLRAQRRQRQKR